MDTKGNQSEVEAILLQDDGSIPNNPKLPLLIYRKVLQKPSAEAFERLYAKHAWGGGWRNGVFPFHHYHSDAHEVLGCYSGSATIQFGGESGVTLRVGAGDAVIIPAGGGHRNLGSSPDFAVTGAYPAGQENYDMGYGKPGERPGADQRIDRVPLPKADPFYGAEGPLKDHWGTT